MNSDLVSYYRDRANEYEQIYAKPERQEDLGEAARALQQIFTGKEVLELACGTGYWTERIARTAKSIFATDINDSVLRIAGTKVYTPAAVTFRQADIFQFPGGTQYESLFAGFIWSHIRLQDLPRFITAVHAQLAPGATVVFMDNNYVAGSNLPVTHTDEAGNTFQTRSLDDGSVYQVLKNFPTDQFLRSALRGRAVDVVLTALEYFWLLKYRVA